MEENVKNVAEATVVNDVITTPVNYDVKEIVAELLKQGCQKVNKLTIRSVSVTKLDNYVRLGINLNRQVPAMLSDESGNYSKSDSNIIFSSNYAIGALLKDSEETAWAANILIEKPKVMAMILTAATIDIIQQEVAAGEPYTNPFSRNGVEQVFDHDVIINHVVKITLSNTGMKQLSKIFDVMLMEDDAE